MLEIFSSGGYRFYLSKRNVLPSTKKPVPLKHLMLGVATSLLAVIAGCGGDSSSEVMSAAPGTTGPVSNTDPARVAVTISQCVPMHAFRLSWTNLLH